MKITEFRFGMLRVPLKTPFKTALRTIDSVEDIVISVHTDTGHVGYGERDGDRRHHRRYPRVDRRGDPQVHRAARDRPGRRRTSIA